MNNAGFSDRAINKLCINLTVKFTKPLTGKRWFFLPVDLFILGLVPFSVKINTEDCAAITRFAQRHRPEDTLLYKVICENIATVFEQREASGKTLPKYVR